MATGSESMKVGQLEIEPLGERLWLGTSALFSNPVIVNMSRGTDHGRIYSEARLLGDVAGAPFKLVDIFMDESRGLAGYAVLLPGPVTNPADPGVRGDPSAVARRLARALLPLHQSGIAYRRFTANAFIQAGDHAVPCDFSRATRVDGRNGLVRTVICDDEIAEPERVLAEYDPPEAQMDWYGGITADVFGLGHLLRTIGLASAGYENLVSRMVELDPGKRLSSIEAVLHQL